MNENNLIKKMATSLTKKHKTVFIDRRIMHPEREWFLGLFFSLIVLLVGVSFMIFNYYQFSNVTTEAVELAEEGVTYRSGLVEDVLDNFQLRKDTYIKIKTELIGSRVVVENVPEIIIDATLPEEIIIDEAAKVEELVPTVEEEKGEGDVVPILSI
jgi:hypothetical protein